jgi:hypothetical protein
MRFISRYWMGTLAFGALGILAILLAQGCGSSSSSSSASGNPTVQAGFP